MNARGLHLRSDASFASIVTARMIKGINDHQGLSLESNMDETISLKNSDYIDNSLTLGKK
jgi:hypothetical protein